MSIKLKILNMIDRFTRSKFGLGFIYNPYWKYRNIYDISDNEKTALLETINLLDWSKVESILNLIFKYINECNFPATADKCIPSNLGYFYLNGYFPFVDALFTHCIIRNFKPQRIIEIGSGYSSLVLKRALNLNYRDDSRIKGELICIDPLPRCEIGRCANEIISKPVQDTDIKIYQTLKGNDILFIDSSHICETGGDVNYIFFNIIPKLKPGVIIHIHDITFPKDYPYSWIVNQLRGYNEQYILFAFLEYNRNFEILWSTSYARVVMKSQLISNKLLQECIPNGVLQKFAGGSFWMRKLKND